VGKEEAMSHTAKEPAGPRASTAGADLVLSRRKFLKLAIVGMAFALPLLGAAGCGGGGAGDEGEEKTNGKKKEGDGGGGGGY
jgi:hypothetical protein